MDISLVIIALGLLIFFSHTFNALFVKTRIPNVLLLMLIGLLVGPIGHLITPQDFGKFGSVFTTITLIAILFESGTGLDLKMLKKSFGGGVLLTIINFIVVLVIGLLIGKYLLGLNWLYSLFLGAALGGTSSAVVIPMLSQLKPGPKAEMLLFLESALSDILCLVVALALMSGIDTGEISVLGIFKNMGISMLFSIIFGFAVGTVWIVVLKKYLMNIKNSMFTTFALAFIVYGFCEHIGWNGGLAILAFGMTAGNIGKAGFIRRLFAMNEESVLNQQERNFYSEIVFVLQTYFFVYIGVSIQLNNGWHLILGALFVAMVFILRPLTTKTMGTKDLSRRDLNLISALGPKGLVAAVLASLPLQSAQQHAKALGLDQDLLSMAVAEKTAERSFSSVIKSMFSRKDSLVESVSENASSLTGSESIDALYSTSVSDTISSGVDSTVVESIQSVATTSSDLAASGVDMSAFDKAVDMLYSGQSIQNVSYAVVLFSIIICSVMVMVIESKYKKESKNLTVTEEPSVSKAENNNPSLDIDEAEANNEADDVKVAESDTENYTDIDEAADETDDYQK